MSLVSSSFVEVGGGEGLVVGGGREEREGEKGRGLEVFSWESSRRSWSFSVLRDWRVVRDAIHSVLVIGDRERESRERTN